MRKPHRSLEELKHPSHETLPDDLKYFASCLVNISNLLEKKNMQEMLQREGHKRYFIDNVVNYVANMKNVYQFWQIQILQNEDFLSFSSQSHQDDLDPMQTAVLNTIKSFFRLRAKYYSFSPFLQQDSVIESDQQTEQCAKRLVGNNDWTKIVFITGIAGTGKTKCLHSCIHYAIENQFMCLVATPTGYLASSYRAVFDNDIDADTIHSSFSVPIDGSSLQLNWALATYDLIIIDELSMVPAHVFNHILSTVQQLPTRPILLVSGDK